MIDSPALRTLRAIKDDAERALQATAYIHEREEAVTTARKIRDDAIRKIADDKGPTNAARLCGVSLSLVKQVRR